MLFIPEDWEPIYYRSYSKSPSFYDVTVGQMIEDRRNADIKIGFCDTSSVYSIQVIEDEDTDSDKEADTEKIIELFIACHWDFDDSYKKKAVPDFVITTPYETVSYKLMKGRDYVCLVFAEELMKESDTVWYQIKEYVKENKLGNPDEIISTLTEEEKCQELSDEFSWTAWCGDWVIFPTQYDGFYNIASVPRNPCGHKTFPVGNG